MDKVYFFFQDTGECICSTLVGRGNHCNKIARGLANKYNRVVYWEWSFSPEKHVIEIG